MDYGYWFYYFKGVKMSDLLTIDGILFLICLGPTFVIILFAVVWKLCTIIINYFVERLSTLNIDPNIEPAPISRGIIDEKKC